MVVQLYNNIWSRHTEFNVIIWITLAESTHFDFNVVSKRPFKCFTVNRVASTLAKNYKAQKSGVTKWCYTGQTWSRRKPDLHKYNIKIMLVLDFSKNNKLWSQHTVNPNKYWKYKSFRAPSSSSGVEVHQHLTKSLASSKACVFLTLSWIYWVSTLNIVTHKSSLDSSIRLVSSIRVFYIFFQCPN